MGAHDAERDGAHAPRLVERAAFGTPGVGDARERERLLGRVDQAGFAGWEFAARLERAGFTVEQRGASDLPARLVARHCLVPPVPSEDPLAANDRRVYFARPAM